MPTVTSNWEGQTLSNDRYNVLECLGSGGMGCVYKAKDTKKGLERTVVIKVPHGQMLDEDPNYAALFHKEIGALVELNHPSIVTILDLETHDGVPFAVLKYMAGGSLRDRQKTYGQRGNQPCPPEQVGGWLLPIARALDYIHNRGYVHRDVKPDNILFDEQGNPLLADFGVVKVAFSSSNAGSTTTRGTPGTPYYVAPEVVKQTGCSGRSDQYSLAVVAWELLSGRVPFDGPTAPIILSLRLFHDLEPLHQIRPSLTSAVSDVVRRGLERDPGKRFPTCQAFVQALETALLARISARQGAVSILDVMPPTPYVPSQKRDIPDFGNPLKPTGSPGDTSLQAGGPSHPGVPYPASYPGVTPPILGPSVIAPPQPPRNRVFIALTLLIAAVAVIVALLVGGPSQETAPTPSPPKTRTASLLPNRPGAALKMDMKELPSGELGVGGWTEDELKMRKFTLSTGLFVGIYEVTVAQFRTFVDADGYRTDAEKAGGAGALDLPTLAFSKNPAIHWRNPGWQQLDTHPAVCVSYSDALAYCAWANKQADGFRYRLLSEEEWEYACRAKTDSLFHSGLANSLEKVANIADQALLLALKNSSTKRQFTTWNDGQAYAGPVGKYGPNAFGLFDMHGNAAEWCSDSFGPNSRVVRGGSWFSLPNECRSAYRRSHPENYGTQEIGFRICCQRAENSS